MFVRLTRHFARGLIDNDHLSDGEDLHASIAGVLAGLLVLSAVAALMFLGKYNSVALAIHGRTPAPFQTLADKLAMALDDRTLLLGGVMILMGLVTVLFWDALALDERDLAVMGPLPVRPAMVLTAKAAAVSLGAALVAVALNLLPAFLFPIVVLLKTSVGPAVVAREMGAHAIAGLAGCAFMFLTLASFRGLAGLGRTDSAIRRMLPIAQVALVIVLITALFALPVLAGRTREALAAGSPTLAFYPPLWFLGLEEVIAGRPQTIAVMLARVGVAALAISFAAAALAQGLALLLRRHRLGIAAGSPDSSTGRLISIGLGRLADALSSDGRVRASFLFTARTLIRNPRHRLYLAGSLGVGLAVAGATIASAAAGLGVGRQALSLKYMGLAAQLNLLFFLIVGLRIAVTLPADLEAGWVFRFLATPARERHLAGTRGAIFVLTVLPLLVVLVPLHAWLWGGYTALVHFAFGVAAGLALLEVVFTDYERMPLVSSFTPGRAVLSPRFGLYVIDYVLFAYVTPGIEQLLIDRTGLLYAWLALFGVLVWRFLTSQSARFHRDRLPVFDDPTAVQQLGLWDTIHGRATTDGDHRHVSRELFENIAGEPAPRVVVPGRPWAWSTDQIRRDVRYSLRRLAMNRGFTAFSVTTLALGIGATTALYSVLYSSMLAPLSVPGLDRVVNIYHSSPMLGSRPYVVLSLPDFEDLRRTQTAFSAVAAHAPFGQVVIADGVGEKARGEAVSGEYFAMLGVQPAAGRLLQPADDRRGGFVAVIDERMWRGRFDARPDIAGRVIRMAGREFEIVGVAPSSFHGVELPNLAPTSVWVPLSAAGVVRAGNPSGDRDDRWLLAHGRLAPGRTLDQARAELAVIARQLDQAFPLGRDLPASLRSPPYISRPWIALPSADRLVSERADPGMHRMARVTMVAAMLVLLVACTNLANLALARGVARRRDLAVRLALGASRWQIVREQLVESGIVAMLGAGTAFVVARVLTAYGIGTTIRYGPWVSVDVAPRLDLASAVVGMSATALALIVSGLVPAIQLTGGHISLAGTAAKGAGARWHGRRILIASQVAVSVALVAIASLCARHVVSSAARSTGLALDRLALVRFDFAVQGWAEAPAIAAMTRLAEAAGRQDGTTSVAIVSGLPLRGFGRSSSVTTRDRPFGPGSYGQAVTLIAATPPVFTTLGVPIVAGRPFDTRDTASSAPVAVVSERTARMLFDTAGAVGHQILRRRPPTADRSEGVEVLTIIGVARDTGSDDVSPPDGVVYVPFAQHYEPFVSIALQMTRTSVAALGMLRALVHRLEPELGVIDAGTGSELSGVENVAFEVMGALSGVLGLFAMVLAMAGLYGVLNDIVAQRTHEIGVRVALGARTRQIVRLMLVDGMRPVVEGLVVGFVVADLAEMAMRPALAKPLPAIDGGMLILLPLPFLIAALAACYFPSRRAASVDANEALREA